MGEVWREKRRFFSKEFREPRTILPSLKTFKKRNVLFTLTGAVGMYLRRITIPTVFSEPVSFSQCFAEHTGFSELLDREAEKLAPDRNVSYIEMKIIPDYVGQHYGCFFSDRYSAVLMCLTLF